eukprot:835711-Amorphochlora_amoeboformis.AAC.1
MPGQEAIRMAAHYTVYSSLCTLFPPRKTFYPKITTIKDKQHRSHNHTVMRTSNLPNPDSRKNEREEPVTLFTPCSEMYAGRGIGRGKRGVADKVPMADGDGSLAGGYD